MIPVDISRKKKNSKAPYIWIMLLLLFGAGAGWSVYRYGPGIYYQFTGDSILRLRSRRENYEGFLAAQNKTAPELYSYIKDSYKLFGVLEKDNPENAEVYFHQGLFMFYELILRSNLTSTSLLQLTGRGYLPSEIEFPDIPGSNIVSLAGRTSILMRKAYALDPNINEEKAALLHLVLSFGDLIHSGRTDPDLIEQIALLDSKLLPSVYYPYFIWLKTGLYTISGKTKEMDQLALILRSAREFPAIGSGDKLTQDELNLFQSEAAFYSRDYIKSLYLLRSVKISPNATNFEKIEASRIEAEIFLIQRGPPAALYFLNETLKTAGGKDAYIERRISEIEKMIRK